MRDKSKTVVEFTTPAGAVGLGTNWLHAGALPIHGAAMLVEAAPDLEEVIVRLPANMAALAPAIIEHAEREAAKHRSKP